MTIEPAFDPEAFRSMGHRVVDLLADHLRSCAAKEIPVLDPVAPDSLLREWSQPFETDPDRPKDPAGAFEDLLKAILTRSNHLHHPGYVGHQISVPPPQATMVEWINALLSNGMAVYEMGPLQTVMEQQVIQFLSESIGFGPNAGGILTHGGSVGNFTALLAARQRMADYDIWTDGQQEPMSVLVSSQAHYCIARAVQCMGWGRDGAVAIPTDHDFRLDPAALTDALSKAKQDGRKVIAVVASACSTASGSFDPIDEIADFCEEHDLWLHVDGAHGASLALSRQHRSRLNGIERADSVVWDLHKMMGLPALSTAVLFAEQRRAYEAFAQEASYLFDSEPPEDQWFNIGHRTMECTKRAMGATAYCMLRVMGTRWFESQVDRQMENATWLFEALQDSSDFEVACRPEANIVCFRHLPVGDTDGPGLDQHQVRLREEVVRGGRFYLVQARLRDTTWLRVSLMNPLTTHHDLEEMISTLREVAIQR